VSGPLSTFTHDEVGNRTRVEPPTGEQIHFAYPLGRPVRERDPFGVERRTSYTEEGFVDRVELHSATALVESYTYAAYDDLGNPGSITSSAEGTTEIQYDPRSRVEKVAYPGGSDSLRARIDSVLRSRSGPMKLRRFWLEFEGELEDGLPPGVLMGCGATAESKKEALELVRLLVFGGEALPRIKKLVEDVDISTLDQNHVVPNMRAPVMRGIWFPLGYEG
jgi:YD repeat-containing protein